MKFLIHRLGEGLEINAEDHGLTIRCPGLDLSRRENWPPDAINAVGGWRTAIEVEQLLELGLAEQQGSAVVVPYSNFEAISLEIPVNVVSGWVEHSPFLLKIGRKSDLGRQDFEYRYEFLLAARSVYLERLGYYVKRAGTNEVFLLDTQMYALVEAMDAFNSLPPDEKTPQESWLTFAKVKGCAKEVGAVLDSVLQKNDVIVPSALGLDMREDQKGALSFLPKCNELATEEFQQVFERNPGAEKLYSLDRPGLGRLRIVLTDDQHEVLRRMKRVRRITGELKDSLKRNPVSVFDGVVEHVELPYSDRVIGIGDFPFAPIPRPDYGTETMGGLWTHPGLEPHLDPATDSDMAASSSEAPKETVDSVAGDNAGEPGTSNSPNASNSPDGMGNLDDGPTEITPRGRKILLIETNEESVSEEFRTEAEQAARPIKFAPYSRPDALRDDRSLHPHQESGVQWLQTCAQVPERRGVLLADDMGLGKTIQILTFLAWCIESGRFPELSRAEPPFRPILIVAPLILLDTRTWEIEMERFFANQGVIFWPVISLHGAQLSHFRRPEAEGRETDIGRPVLDLDRIQRHKVVITNYETVKNYQHSFAHFRNGRPIWSVIVADEAQEFKIPNTKISHAMKALQADFEIACTGTPVENRLLDLWNVYDVVQPGLLDSARQFIDSYERKIGGANRESSLGDLKNKLLFQKPHAFLLRRNKSEVANLPAKRIVPLYSSMSSSEVDLHQMLLNELRRETNPASFLAVLHRFAQLYQHPAMLTGDAEALSPQELLAQSSKLRDVVRKLHEIRGYREKVIIFARHRAMQGILAKVLQPEFGIPVRIINGETKMKAGAFRAQGARNRAGILREFKETQGFNILVLSPFVAGIGLTIIEANHVMHYGRWWNPAVESQATDRAYRIGQTKEVFVYLPILTDPSGRVSPTFDERLNDLMLAKFRLAEDFLRPLPAEDEMGADLFKDLRAEAAIKDDGGGEQL